jgi:hypothetical protein
MTIEALIPYITSAGIPPLALAIFYYVTKPSDKHRWRVPASAWLNPVGVQVVGQKTILLVLLVWITFSRLNPDWPGRQLIAIGLYLLLVAAFWAFFVVQRWVQKPYEAAIRKRRPKRDG